MNENNTSMASGAQQPAQPPNLQVVTPPPMAQETEYTKRMKEHFHFFGPITFLYACVYALCMFRNDAGVAFPFFIAASLLYLCFSLSKLEITLQKGSSFYMVSMVLLAVSTFCTDDGRIIALNKTGIFLLMMSLLLKQFYDTSKWKLGKYFDSIFVMTFACLGCLPRPFSDGMNYYKGKQKNGKVWYAVLGLIIAVPLLVVVLLLLSSADAVFRDVTGRLLDSISIENIFNIVFRVAFLFMASYMLLAYLCEKHISEQVKDRRTGEPIIAITVTTLLSAIYLLFSGIQIIYLFLGQMQLPEGYTYAMYAREGFFQLLAVSILNLVIVLMCMSLFKESKVLKVVLTLMSLCTFIMIASSALRMIIYIRYYYMTFLRLFVLWALVVLFLLFVGIIINIVKESFPLFRYGVVVVTVLYLALSFSHPDYIIASINVANAAYDDTTKWEVSEGDFFQNSQPYRDYRYLSELSADAAPVLLPYMAELGYDLESLYTEDTWEAYHDRMGFGYHYMEHLREVTEHLNIRTFNVSRYMAKKQMERLCAR
ncbi:MAG: DUF4173 domain-containing protein [Lachnospiraceae bacterium]|nr:DUF4173 domain-containing protein [Lachnospiraceae bacterium]